MGNTVDVNENEYAVASFEQKPAAVRKLESVVIQMTAQEHSNVEVFGIKATRGNLRWLDGAT